MLEIFFETVALLLIEITAATLIGWSVAEILPERLRQDTRFYLSPTIGFAVITLFATILGRSFPLGGTVLLPCMIMLAAICIVFYLSDLKLALRHSVFICIFSIICGISMLVPLYFYGAWNPHNDGFTYLVHAEWLQNNSYNDIISSDQVTPSTTQIALYQKAGLRMGGSFFFGLLKSISNIRWAYNVYPAVVLGPMAASSLSIGFPLSLKLEKYNTLVKLSLLAIPCLAFGGLTFAPNYGFLPQTIGICFSSGLLFFLGKIYREILDFELRYKEIFGYGLVLSVLFCASVYAYSELSPFLVVCIALSLAYFYFLQLKNSTSSINHIKSVINIFTSVLIATIFILNTELLRALKAILAQSGAVVGTPVDWNIVGFIGHAYGVHGGAWDLLQWSLPQFRNTTEYNNNTFIVFILVIITSLAFFCKKNRDLVRVELLPIIFINLLFIFGFLYFRYVAKNPFDVGIGQSWSEFKISDWDNIFLIVFLLMSILSLGDYSRKFLLFIVFSILSIEIYISSYNSLIRIRPTVAVYNNQKDLATFYKDLRFEIEKQCPHNMPIYLSLSDSGESIKLRQMIAYLLPDRYVKSNWKSDGYIFWYLDPSQQDKNPDKGDCLIESSRGYESLLVNGQNFGPFRIGLYDGRNNYIKDIRGGYDRENDEKDWWYWVDQKLKINISDLSQQADRTNLRINFLFLLHGINNLTLELIYKTGEHKIILLQPNNGVSGEFNQDLSDNLENLASIEIISGGESSRLSPTDSRRASFMIKNLKISNNK